MSGDKFAGTAHPEAIDADAVCARCSTVNAEGTLLCKVCGNNLRDQRAIRLQADQAMDLENSGRRRRAWASGVLFILAIVLIISTLVNQEMIVNWMIGVNTPTESASDLWRGPESDVFDDMAATLEERGVTEELALEAASTPVASESIDGVYALFLGEEYVGAALVQLQDAELYFVAELQGGEEVRGTAFEEGSHYTATRENAAIRMRRDGLTPLRGVAMPQGNGVVDCIGDDLNRAPISFSAIHLAAE